MELLIVLAIIALLVSLGTVSYTSAQKKSRDSRRSSDLHAIQNAFEQYYGDNAKYPTSASCTASSTYLPAGVPKDPKTGVAYTITCDATGTTYCSCALLEGTTTGGNATNATCTMESGAYFCVKNLQ